MGLVQVERYYAQCPCYCLATCNVLLSYFYYSHLTFQSIEREVRATSTICWLRGYVERINFNV